jgi:hypothetical protein
MWFSDNNGQNWLDEGPWNGPYDVIIYDESGDPDAHRTYVYGTDIDPDTETFHMGLTFTASDSGEWLDGCWHVMMQHNADYETYPLGFKDIYKYAPSGPVKCGEVDSDPPGRSDCGKIIDAKDRMYGLKRVHTYFIMDLHLRKNESGDYMPLVFFGQKWGKPAANYWEEPALICAKWNTSTEQWDLIRISEDLDMVPRETRGGCPGGMDVHNNPNIFFASLGKMWVHAKPETDVASANTSPKTGSDLFAMVDDGPYDCDGDDTYISMYDNAAYVLFSSTKYSTNPNFDKTSKKIFGVRVQVAARNMYSDTGELRPYLKIDGTEYLGDPSSLAGYYYQRIEHIWDKNPDTDEDWTWDDYKNAEFGVKQLTASQWVRVSRVHKAALYTYAADEKHTSSEMWQLISEDGGDTWEPRELSCNTCEGVPIANAALKVVNDLIYVVWSVGEKIFFTINEVSKYRKMQPGGRDVRLFYGQTEIPRIIDYPGTIGSKIYFKVQETIPVNDEYGPNDYYLLITNPNEDENALGDPTDVFLFHKSFEGMAEDEQLQTDPDWDVEDGFYRGYASPPNESSKVFAGQVSIESVQDTHTLCRAKTEIDASGLTNIMIMGTFRLQATPSGTDKRIRIGVESTTGKTFEAGFKRSGYLVPTYYNGSSWIDPNVPAAESWIQNINRINIQLKSTG